ncbi:TPA: HAD hydrolase family protein [Neisseria gonorrhoeae]
MNLPFRAMVSDLGGTLLTPEHLVGDLTIDTLRVLEQKGVDIILATGRNHTDMSSILGKIGAERAVMITSNGARVRDLQGNLLYSNSLPEELALELYKTSYVGNLIQIPRFCRHQ